MNVLLDTSAYSALQRGDTVIGTVRSGQPEFAAGSGKLQVIHLEMTDQAALDAAVEAAFAVTGRIDVLVNNAGYGLLGTLEHATEEQIAHLFAVDVFGPIRLIRAALPRLRAQGSGHIINITSIAGRAPGAGSPLYAAAKYALEGLSHSLAQELEEGAGVLRRAVRARGAAGKGVAFRAEIGRALRDAPGILPAAWAS